MRGQRRGQQLGEFAQGARVPGVDLQVGGEGRRVVAGRRDGEVGQVVEGILAVEELQVEGRCVLAIDDISLVCHGRRDAMDVAQLSVELIRRPDE